MGSRFGINLVRYVQYVTGRFQPPDAICGTIGQAISGFLIWYQDPSGPKLCLAASGLRCGPRSPGAGGQVVARALFDAGLIDEVYLLVHPLVLGKGKRLFAGDSRFGLQLVNTEWFDSGILLLIDRPDRAEEKG